MLFRSLTQLVARFAAPALILIAQAASAWAEEAARKPRNPDERFPPGLVRAIEPLANPIGRTTRRLVVRSGYLKGDAEFIAWLKARIRPGDVFAVTNRGALTAHLIPGLFSHTLAYLGSEADLRRLGIWDHPKIVPLQKSVRAGKVMIEATEKGVYLSNWRVALNADSVLVARPGGTGGLPRDRQRLAVLTLAEHVGTPFDFHFNARQDGKLFCVELLQHAIPDIRLAQQVIYGRHTIKPVALAEAVFQPGSRIGFVGYVEGRRGRGFDTLSRNDLKTALARAGKKPAPAPRPACPVDRSR